MAITRRQFGIGIVALGLAGLAYARFAESTWLMVRRSSLHLADANLRAPLRILHLSDFHWSRSVSLSFIARAVRLGIEQEPDLICLTGDYITAGEQQNLDDYAEVLRPLAGTAPTFATLGNHDGGAWSLGHGGFRDPGTMRALLERAGITVLINEILRTTSPAGVIELVGLGDPWAGWCDPRRAFGHDQSAAVSREEDAPGRNLRILLSHNPDTKEDVGGEPWDLMLCGHTHGGQLVIPGLGAPVVPVRDRRYVAGLNSWNGRWIYTTRGVGCLYGIRFHCRPEVTVLTLS